MPQAVIDLNVIISGLIVPREFAYYVWAAWLANRYTLVISEGMIQELAGKLREPRIAHRYRVTAQEIRYVSALLRSQASLVEVSWDHLPSVTGDPEDDLVLETAQVGAAQYLVTRDQRLLDLGSHAGTQIVTPHQFLPRLAR